MSTPEREGEAMPRIMLEPVDAVALTILVENVYDIFMPNQGPAARAGPGQTTGRMDSSIMVNHFVPDQLGGEHGFSMLGDVRPRGAPHRILFDLGVSPTGMIENM